MINKVMLLGRVGKDADIKNFDAGKSVVKFSLATSENYKDSNGEWQEKTEWHNIVVWTQNAERYAKSIIKGALVHCEGKIQTRSWEQDGVKKYMTEINVPYPKVIKEQGSGNSANPNRGQQASAPQSAPKPVLSEPTEDDDDDDLPF
jgi:single-strand DNA-binding protein